MNLSAQVTANDSRSLIRRYKESEWRSTRLEVLREFANTEFSDQRAILFLVDVVRSNEDLAEQKLAVFALGQKKSASRFLKNYYSICNEALKADVAYALGQFQDEGAVVLLRADFKKALDKNDSLWLKNIVLSLGELKVFSSLADVRSLLERKVQEEFLDRDLISAILFTLGKLDRDPAFLLSFRKYFLSDSLLFQVFQNVSGQIQIRSQFKIEDYLGKLVQNTNPHPSLPLELLAFPEKEVTEGLGLIDSEKEGGSLLLALRGVPFSSRKEWIEKVWSGAKDPVRSWFEKVPAFSGADEWIKKNKPSQLDLRVAWLQMALRTSESPEMLGELFLDEADVFLKEGNASLAQAMDYLNVWMDWAFTEAPEAVVLHVKKWETIKAPIEVKGRIFRILAELGSVKSFREVLAAWVQEKSREWSPEGFTRALRNSYLMMLDRFPAAADFKGLYDMWSKLDDAEKKGSAPRILSVLEKTKMVSGENAMLLKWLKEIESNSSPEIQMAILKFLRVNPLAEWEEYVLDRAQPTSSIPVLLQAVIALKHYSQSQDASRALLVYLSQEWKKKNESLCGRTLDSLCAHSTLIAKKGVLEFLKENILDEIVVDKVYRSFDPQNKGGVDFVQTLEKLAQENPNHASWEKLVQLRDRVQLATKHEGKAGAGSVAVSELDLGIAQVIPQFKKLDSITQSALRAAEQLFADESTAPVDKAPIVLEYCKALDLVLEKNLGQKYLFPKLDTAIHDFQTLWHGIGFSDDYPSLEKVLNSLGLKNKLATDYFPLHKMKLMSQTFFNGKISQDRYKVFDGLRAWAVILLVFCRKLPAGSNHGGPMIKLTGLTDEQCIQMAKKLMTLQDLRNPAAHRQTYTDMNSIRNIRSEAIELINTASKI